MRLLFCALISINLRLVLAATGDESAITPQTLHSVGWQNSTARRGTWDIIINCATTIFACTWSIQHLNVPGPLSYDGTFKKLLRACKWMVITILFPEFIMAHACLELILAIQATELVKKHNFIKVAKYPWVIRLLVPDRPRDFETDRRCWQIENQVSNQQEPEWTLTHSYFANMGGFYYEDEDIHFPLTTPQYAEEFRQFSLPKVSEEDIRDKSKQDFFAKGIAVLQIAQLVLSLIVRKLRGLPFSQLETLTLGLAICGIGIYALYWHKPQAISVPIMVARKEFSEIPSQRKTYDSFWEVLKNPKGLSEVNTTHRIKNDNIPLGTSQTGQMGIPILAMMSVVFGCIHLIAWNFEFPTGVEKLLWRISAVLSITVPFIGLFMLPLAQVVVQAGSPSVFIRGCLSLLRELSWNSSSRGQAVQASQELEEIYNNLDTIHLDECPLYKDIFIDQGGNPTLQTQMIDFVEKNEPFENRNSLDLPKDFILHFRLLVKLMQGKGPKNLVAQARPTKFPQKALLPQKLNLFILYVTSLTYCFARLTIMATALSSLRSLPNGVYDTTWTRDIPTIQ